MDFHNPKPRGKIRKDPVSNKLTNGSQTPRKRKDEGNLFYIIWKDVNSEVI